MLSGQSSTTSYAAVIRTLENTIPERLDKHEIPGLALALVEGDRLVWAAGFGYTDYEKTHPVTADTPFSLQSISKTYTAAGFLVMASQGLATLDEPLVKYYPTFRVNSRLGAGEAQRITFRHLLSHWAGLTHEAPVGGNYDSRPCAFEEHIRSISDTWLRFPVGKCHWYSNLGIDLAGYALQLISGKPFARCMQEALLEPLGMTHSSFDQAWIMENHVYARGHVGKYPLPPLIIPMIPAGGLFATARDMARFLSFQLAGGVVGGKRLIAPELLEEMCRPQFAVERQTGGYGLGIAIGRQFGTTLFTHGGGGYGYLALQEWLPEYNLGIVVLTNDAHHPNVHYTIRDVALRGMIEEKLGSIPEEKATRYDEQPVIHLEEGPLRRLEGSYRGRGFLVPVQVSDTKLTMWEKPLDPVSPTEFVSSDGERVTFCLDESGQPAALQLLNDWGFGYYPLDHSPHDDPGPDKAEWEPFTGIYSLRAFRGIYFSVVLVKNGDLYIGDRVQDARLQEFAPGLFFAADGDAVCFGEGTMTWGNVTLVKESDPYTQALELVSTNPDDRRLLDDSLNSLGEAYHTLGEQQKALALFSLNARFHPDWTPGLMRLAEIYMEIGNETGAKEAIQRILDKHPENEAARRFLVSKGL